MKRVLWTEEAVEELRRCYPHESTQGLATRLGRDLSSVYQKAAALGLTKTVEYLASPAACRLRRGGDAHPGKATQFKKGQTPVNKGLRRPGWGPGRMKETQFKKGTRLGAAQHNWQPIGTVRKDTEGYLRIKVREHLPGEFTGFGNTKVWPLLQRHVWEQHHGPIPPAHAICFKDGDRSNCDIANLECVSRSDLMRRNTVHNLPKELAEIVQLRGALNRKIRRRAKQQTI